MSQLICWECHRVLRRAHVRRGAHVDVLEEWDNSELEPGFRIGACPLHGSTLLRERSGPPGLKLRRARQLCDPMYWQPQLNFGGRA